MAKHLVFVTLWVTEGAEDDFRAFESRSLNIAARHGGVLVRAVRLCERAAGTLMPYEAHVLEFPGAQAFQAFRSDPDSRALVSERARLVVRADLVEGSPIDPTEFDPRKFGGEGA